MRSRIFLTACSVTIAMITLAVSPSDGRAQGRLGNPVAPTGPHPVSQPTTIAAYAIVMGAGTLNPVNIGNALSFTLTDPSVQASNAARQVTTPGNVVLQMPATAVATRALMQQQAAGAPFTMAINALNVNGYVLLSYTLYNARVAAYQMTYTGAVQAATATISYTSIAITPQQIGLTVPTITRPQLQAP